MTVLPIHSVPVLTCIFIPVGSDWRLGCLRRRSGRVPEVSPEVPGGGPEFSREVPGGFPEFSRKVPDEGSGRGR